MALQSSCLVFNKPKSSFIRHIINRYNIKLFIRIVVSLILTHIIGYQFKTIDAAPGRRKQRIKSTTTDNKIFSYQNSDILNSTSVTKLYENVTSTIFNNFLLETTSKWQPGQMKNCTEPAIDEFPDDVFTQFQRRHGAILFHLLACIYIFIAIAKLVDDYFISALDKLCSTLNLDEDVAGATFMAAGSSSPELFTSIIGIFVAKGDVGVGTIVGSAVFNIVCVVGICGLFVNGATRLTRWPLCRDSVYYSLSIIVLIICLSDGKITLFESIFLLLMYSGYITIMCYNKKIQAIIFERWQIIKRYNEIEEPIINYSQSQKSYGMNMLYQNFAENQDEENQKDFSKNSINKYIGMSHSSLDFEMAALKLMMSRYFRGRTRFRMAVRLVISQIKLHNQRYQNPAKVVNNNQRFSCYQGRTPSLLALESNYDDWKIIPNYHYDLIGFIKWMIMAPIKISFHYTIPDCRNPKWSQWYPLTFIMTIAWLSLLTYFMIWMVTVIGFTFGIPDSVMGITFLAAGSSVPDALSSVFVVRQGLVDMGVSNTFGSNVFDLLVGLALPWFFKTLISGEAIHINSNGLMYDSVLLLGIVAVTMMSFHGRKWYLDKFLGSFFLAVYGIFITFSLLIELNIFGFVNPPMCQT